LYNLWPGLSPPNIWVQWSDIWITVFSVAYAHSQHESVRRGGVEAPNFPSGNVLMPVAGLVEMAQAGYAEDDIKRFLWEHSKIPRSELVRAVLAGKAKTIHWTPAEGQAVPLVPTPEQLTIVVAGGSQAGHAYWMQVGSTQYTIKESGMTIDDLFTVHLLEILPINFLWPHSGKALTKKD
jgi:hypothetical protein